MQDGRKSHILESAWGMQMAIVAFARFVVGYHDAGSIEFQPETMHPVIALMPDQKMWKYRGTLRLGHIRVYWMKIPGALPFMERGRSPRDTDTAMRSITITGASWKKQGCTWRGCPRDQRIVEMIEITDHPFYIGTQAHPEFKSRPNRPHPLLPGL